MFGRGNRWQEECLQHLRQLESQVQELKTEAKELRISHQRLSSQLKILGKKVAMRLPISMESLDKGLPYDLIFSDEVDVWKKATREGVVLDLRQAGDKLPFEAHRIPLEQLSQKLNELSKERAYLLICENGIRSVSASEVLGAQGFSFIYILQGGAKSFSKKSEENKSRESEVFV